MKLADIENLTFAELKSRRGELIEGAATADDRGDAIERFVDARTDAKQRDERMAEQAAALQLYNVAIEGDGTKNQPGYKKTIESLEADIRAAAAREVAANQLLTEAKAEIAKLETKADEDQALVSDATSEVRTTRRLLDNVAKAISGAVEAQKVAIVDAE